MTIQTRVNFADFVSNFKQRKLLNQHFFQNIFKVKVVQNRPQNIRKVRQFYICITNCFITIQNWVNFVIFCRSIYFCYVLSAKSFYNLKICFVKYFKHKCCHTGLTWFLFSRFEDTDFFVKQFLLWKVKRLHFESSAEVLKVLR